MFVAEFLLNEQNYALYLDKCFEIKCIIKNRVKKHCKSSFQILNHDKKYQKARLTYGTLKSKKNKTNEEKETFLLAKEYLSSRIKEVGLTKADLYKYASVLQKKYRAYVSSQEVNAMVDEVLEGVDNILYGNGKTLHFKKFGQENTLSSKSLINGSQFALLEKVLKNGKIILVPTILRTTNRKDKKTNKKVWLEFPLIVKDYDKYNQCIMNGIISGEYKVKYVRLIRKPFNNGFRYYAQLIINGIPPLKHTKGIGKCGIDMGVSSVASVSDDLCLLEDLAPDIDSYNKQIITLQKKLEQSRRVNNKECYNKDGTIKKGAKFKNTKNYYRILRRLKTLNRKRNEYVKQRHCMLANQIVEHCSEIYLEEMNFKSLHKRAKDKPNKSEKENINNNYQDKVTIITNKKGITKKVHKRRKKKRYGKTLQNKSPGAMVVTLKNKCEFYNIPLIEISPTTYKGSQYNHLLDEYIKKDLKDRWNNFFYNEKLIKIQRDLYSAFLYQNPQETFLKPDRQLCNTKFDNFIQMHNECIENLMKNNPKPLSCFGLNEYKKFNN